MPVREFPFSEEHKECTLLFTVSGTAPTQEEARDEVFMAVLEAGGNSVVFVGARMTRNPETGKLLAFTERGLAYLCTE